MKRIISLFLAALLVGQILTLFFVSEAEAAIETRNYGWTLGKYDTGKKIFTPSNTNEFEWAYTSTNKMRVRTIGPWTVNQNSSTNRVGSIISFVDKNSPEDNGYPMIGEPQWVDWIKQFKGDEEFVRKALDTWDIKTPSGTFKFANFSQLVELCGGRGVSYNIEKASSYYLSSERPYATLLANKTSVKAGESVTFTIRGQSNTEYSKFIDLSFAGAGKTIWADKRFPGPRVDTTYSYTFDSPGTYTFSIIVKDSVWRKATSTVKIAVGQDVPPPPPDQPPSDPPDDPVEEPNQDPTARFNWPMECYETDTVDVTENSYDRDGEIVDWRWRFTDSTGVTHNLAQGGGQVTFDKPGTYELRLTVEDDDGATDSVTKTILVKPPIPAGKIDYSGSLKENRKVVLSSERSDSPSKFPVDHSRDQWTITPVSGGAAADIKFGQKNGSTQEVLFKKAGTYKIGLKVANSRYESEWAYREITISPDLQPTANFILPAILFREPLDQSYAIIKLTDKSYSPDEDIISQRTWKYKFDSNNNGDFSDDLWVVLDSNNNLGPYLRVNHVGKYLFELEVKEGFGQPTIPEFITDADYRRGDTSNKAASEKVVEIKNIAPVTSFSAGIKPKVDVVFSQGYLQNYATRFPNMISSLDSIVGTKLRAKDIDAAFYNTAYSVSPEWILRSSSGPWGPDNINSDGDGYYAEKRIFDLGKSINSADIVNGWFSFDGYCPANDTTNWSVAVSNDNVTWYRIYNWISPSQPSAWRPSQTISITPGSIPIPSFRYIKAYIDPTDYALDSFSVNILLNSTNSSINKSDSTQQAATVLDLGKTISTNSLSEYRLQFQGSANGTYTLAVSPDNVNWTTVSSWNCAKATNLTYVWQWKYIQKSSISIPEFRYCKLTAPSSAKVNLMQQIVTYTSGTRASLSDVQTRANQTFRSDAMKFVVSLAEEPYIDATSDNYANTANALNQKNSDLVVFANTASQPSVLQLTSKVNKQKIILASTDLNPALDQLADYIISRANSLQMSNEIPILLNQSLTFSPSYSDYEEDPKFAESWTYLHDPTFVDNNNGISTYNGKTLATPVSTFDKYGRYNIYYRAQDDPALSDFRFSNYRLWSDPAPTAIIVHRKPIAGFSVQPGTLYITDTSYDPDFQYKRPDKGIVEWFWQWKKAADTGWTAGKPIGITQPGDYYFYLQVKDNYGVWSDPYQMAITVTNLNRPPNADFNWTPTLIFEKDDVNLKNQSFDPDGDPLTCQWTVFDPAGTTKQYSSWNAFISDALPGPYWVTLRVWDNRGGTDVVTKSFTVNKLSVSGYVKHTDEWNAKRISFNRSVSGSDNAPRGYNVFWAGERFILSADTTDTASSLTKAAAVKVSMPALGIETDLQGNADKTNWSGAMWEERMVNLADGPYRFIFTAQYTNGAQKTCEVWVNISESIYDYYLFHRAE